MTTWYPLLFGAALGLVILAALAGGASLIARDREDRAFLRAVGATFGVAGGGPLVVLLPMLALYPGSIV